MWWLGFEIESTFFLCPVEHEREISNFGVTKTKNLERLHDSVATLNSLVSLHYLVSNKWVKSFLSFGLNSYSYLILHFWFLL